MSASLNLAQSYLGKHVKVIIDRKLGSKHPKWDFNYPVNYGYLEGQKAPDGEGLDAYILNVSEPVDFFTGVCIAIVHRLNDDDDKLVIVPEWEVPTDAKIEKAVEFQEKWFEHEIIRT